MDHATWNGLVSATQDPSPSLLAKRHEQPAARDAVMLGKSSGVFKERGQEHAVASSMAVSMRSTLDGLEGTL